MSRRKAARKERRLERDRQRRRDVPAAAHDTNARKMKVRFGELCRLFGARYDAPPLPDDDAGREDLRVLLNTYAVFCAPQNRRRLALALIAGWAPWMPAAEADELVARIVGRPWHYSSETLAEKLNVTMVEHAWWKLRTIGVAGETKAQRQVRLAAWRKVFKMVERAKAGKPTREQYEATSLSRTKPWEAAGMSRAQWYRRRKRGETGTERAPTYTEHQPVSLARETGTERVYVDAAYTRHQRVSPMPTAESVEPTSIDPALMREYHGRPSGQGTGGQGRRRYALSTEPWAMRQWGGNTGLRLVVDNTIERVAA